MSDDSWTVRVAGSPVPKGSMVCIGGGRVTKTGRGLHQLQPDNKKILKPWVDVLTLAGQRLREKVGWTLRDPVSMDITFTVPRPPTVTRDWPAVRPDLDKLQRAVLDAFTTAGVWADDGQVVEITTRKTYPDTHTPEALDRPGARITIWRTDDQQDTLI